MYIPPCGIEIRLPVKVFILLRGSGRKVRGESGLRRDMRHNMKNGLGEGESASM